MCMLVMTISAPLTGVGCQGTLVKGRPQKILDAYGARRLARLLAGKWLLGEGERSRILESSVARLKESRPHMAHPRDWSIGP
jgi:hypothetical protein